MVTKVLLAMGLAAAVIGCRAEEGKGGGAESQNAFAERYLNGQGRLWLRVQPDSVGIRYGVNYVASCDAGHDQKRSFASPQRTVQRIDFFQTIRQYPGGRWEAYGPVWKVSDFGTATFERDSDGIPVVRGACIANGWCQDCRR